MKHGNDTIRSSNEDQRVMISFLSGERRKAMPDARHWSPRS